MTLEASWRRSFLWTVVLVYVLHGVLGSNEDPPYPTLSPRSPVFRRMEYDLGQGPQVAWVYVEPSIETFYSSPSSTSSQAPRDRVPSAFPGRHVKFFNLRTTPVDLYWSPPFEEEEEPKLVRTLRPLSTAGFLSFAGDLFWPVDPNDDEEALDEFQVEWDGPNLFPVVPDPTVDDSPSMAPSALQTQRQVAVTWLQQTLAFGEYYYEMTGRPYLSRYGRRPPRHWMWPADYFGQTHTVTTKEVKAESAKQRERVVSVDGSSLPVEQPEEPEEWNMTLTVVSCAPRVFEIPNFVSPTEVEHLIELAAANQWTDSLIGDQSSKQTDNATKEATEGSRTSQNTWIGHHDSPIVERIYRRAADLLGMDHDNKAAEESLQLVRYQVGQEYKAHYDFGFPDPTHPRQPTRFATLLIYLTDVAAGGETSFPRWSNAETKEDLQVAPQSGKAALFYMQTPDGNMDEMSVHASLPVLEGEKILANLWFWDPHVSIESLQ